MFDRNEYVKIIEEVRNLELGALDGYIEKKLVPLQNEHDYFVETLYKDIHYVLGDLDDEGDNDLVIENGDFAVENGQLKLTGYQTKLHHLTVWLHMQVVSKFMELPNKRDALENFIPRMQNFEKYELNKFDYTVEYRAKLDAIKWSIKQERFINYKKPNRFIKFWIRTFNYFKQHLKLTAGPIELDFSDKK